MTAPKPHSKAISRRLRPALCLMAVVSLSPALAQPEGSAVTDRAASAAALRETMVQILTSGLTPEQQSARMAALREEQMKLIPIPQAEPPANAARPTTPGTQQEENAAALRETLVTARTPEESIRLVNELFRLNPGAYALPAPAGDRQSLLAARAALSGQTGPAEESRDAILEILASARTPQESVQLMQQFFTLNRETLLSLAAPNLRPTTFPSK